MTRGLFAKRTPAYAATAHDDLLPPMPRADAREGGLLHGMRTLLCGACKRACDELQCLADGNARACKLRRIAVGDAGALLAPLVVTERVAK